MCQEIRIRGVDLAGPVGAADLVRRRRSVVRDNHLGDPAEVLERPYMAREEVRQLLRSRGLGEAVARSPENGDEELDLLDLAALGASSYSFAEATQTQQSADFLASHVRAFEYLGGVTAALVPDQLKSADSRACRYEPGIQRDYEQLAEHYDTVILPARPGKPRDKAKVEAAVLVAQRWILAPLLHSAASR